MPVVLIKSLLEIRFFVSLLRLMILISGFKDLPPRPVILLDHILHKGLVNGTFFFL